MNALDEAAVPHGNVARKRASLCYRNGWLGSEAMVAATGHVLEQIPGQHLGLLPSASTGARSAQTRQAAMKEGNFVSSDQATSLFGALVRSRLPLAAAGAAPLLRLTVPATIEPERVLVPSSLELSPGNAPGSLCADQTSDEGQMSDGQQVLLAGKCWETLAESASHVTFNEAMYQETQRLSSDVSSAQFSWEECCQLHLPHLGWESASLNSRGASMLRDVQLGTSIRAEYSQSSFQVRYRIPSNTC